jgi:hypothetical protein
MGDQQVLETAKSITVNSYAALEALTPLSVNIYTDPQEMVKAIEATQLHYRFFDETGKEIKFYQDAIAHLGVDRPQEYIEEFKQRDTSSKQDKKMLFMYVLLGVGSLIGIHYPTLNEGWIFRAVMMVVLGYGTIVAIQNKDRFDLALFGTLFLLGSLLSIITPFGH